MGHPRSVLPSPPPLHPKITEHNHIITHTCRVHTNHATNQPTKPGPGLGRPLRALPPREPLPRRRRRPLLPHGAQPGQLRCVYTPPGLYVYKHKLLLEGGVDSKGGGSGKGTVFSPIVLSRGNYGACARFCSFVGWGDSEGTDRIQPTDPPAPRPTSNHHLSSPSQGSTGGKGCSWRGAGCAAPSL